jgi:hypothetical protein
MSRFIAILLACVTGLGAAFLFGYVAGIVRPCRGEQLSCSITQVLGLVYTPVFSAAALLAFSVAAFWKSDRRALNNALLLPLVPFLLLVVYIKYSEFSVREFHDIREHDIQELLQVVIPIILTLVIPWTLLLRFAGWAKIENNAHG